MESICLTFSLLLCGLDLRAGKPLSFQSAAAFDAQCDTRTHACFHVPSPFVLSTSLYLPGHRDNSITTRTLAPTHSQTTN